MRAESGHIYDLWNAGGPFVGTSGRPHARVTVEVGWVLGAWNAVVDSFRKPPLRWFQRADESQVETEIPNLQTIQIERSIDQDAATCVIRILNQNMSIVGTPPTNEEEFGNPGYYTFSRGSSSEATSRWGHVPNTWYDVLVPDALLRTYQGFGGHAKTRTQAVADGNLILTGVWLVDEVRITTGGVLELRCRDMAKLLIDQPLYPPLVPQFDADGCDVYPLRYQRYFTMHGTQSYRIPYGLSLPPEENPTGRVIHGIEYATSTSPCKGDGEGYWLVGDDGGVFSYGYINWFGSKHNRGDYLNQPIRGMTATVTHQGYWLMGGDGGVFAFGDAEFYGSVPGLDIAVANLIAIERSKGAAGYYLFGDDGSVYAFGDAIFSGSGVDVVADTVVAADVKRSGTEGYWVVTNTGIVYEFGGAVHYGDLDGEGFSDVVAMAASVDGGGYYLLRADGSVYTFGNAVYYGSPVDQATPIVLNDPATDIAVHPDSIGYWIAAEDGGVFTYGTVALNFYGSLPGPWVNLALVDGNYFDYCVDEKTEALTKRGWLKYDEIHDGDEVLGIDADTGQGQWHNVNGVYRQYRRREMVAMKGASFDSLTTPDHRWLVKWGDGRLRWTCSDALRTTDLIPLSVSTEHLPTIASYSDDFVALVAWFWTEGWWIGANGAATSQSRTKNPENCDIIEGILTRLYGPPGPMTYRRGIPHATTTEGPSWNIDARADSGVQTYMLAARVGAELHKVCDQEKAVSFEFLSSLTKAQLDLFINYSMLGDATCNKERRRAMLHPERGEKSECLTQASEDRIRSFEIACVLAGHPVVTHDRIYKGKPVWATTLLKCDTTSMVRSKSKVGAARYEREWYEGVVWCPQTDLGNWVCRRNGSIHVTGNSDIVKDMLRWSGFWLNDGGVSSQPFGNIESTGIVNNTQDGAMPDDMFDKQPPIDVINKLKAVVGYIFWVDERGAARFECVDEKTEALSQRGWVTHEDLQPGDRILTFDRETRESYWEMVDSVNRYTVSGQPMVSLESRSHSSLTTPNHRWWVEPAHGGTGRWRTSGAFTTEDCVPIVVPHRASVEATYSDEFVELVGWWITEGHDGDVDSGSYICQSKTANPEKCERIHQCFVKLYGSEGRSQGRGWNRKNFPSRPNDYCWTFGHQVFADLNAVAPGRVTTMEFLIKLTSAQARLLVETAMDGDGNRYTVNGYGPYARYTQKDEQAIRALEVACVLAGVAPRTTFDSRKRVHRMSHLESKRIKPASARRRVESYSGVVWCPTLRENSVWLARRGGTVYYTGNSPNWWSPGNFLELGTHTDTIPVIDEAVQLTQYAVSYADASMRSKIIIASRQPDPNGSFSDGTVFTEHISTNVAALRGLHKPFMWTNEAFLSPAEQEVMAELVDLHINFQRRLGSVTCVANPLLQVNDQVKIVERETSETYVHYVRTISMTQDLESGEYTMTLGTNWLGDEDAWAIG